MAAQSERNGVSFAGIFSAVDAAALPTDLGALVKADLKISNHTSGPLRFSLYHSVFPELVDKAGAVVPFDYGWNRSLMPLPSDYPLLPPGESLVIPLEGVMKFRSGQVNWQGNDGTMGHWKVTRVAAPYRFRLRYRQIEASVDLPESQPEVLGGLWTGEMVTESVDLPAKFGD